MKGRICMGLFSVVDMCPRLGEEPQMGLTRPRHTPPQGNNRSSSYLLLLPTTKPASQPTSERECVEPGYTLASTEHAQNVTDVLSTEAQAALSHSPQFRAIWKSLSDRSLFTCQFHVHFIHTLLLPCTCGCRKL